jgi:hypothetical protein
MTPRRLCASVAALAALLVAAPAQAEPVPTRDCGPYQQDADVAFAERVAARSTLMSAREAKQEARERYQARPTTKNREASRAASKAAQLAWYTLQGKRYTLTLLRDRLEICQGPVGVTITGAYVYEGAGYPLILADTMYNMPVGRAFEFWRYGDGEPVLRDVPTFVDHDVDPDPDDYGNYLLNSHLYDGLGYGTCDGAPGETITVEFWTDQQREGYQLASTTFDNPCR